MPLATNETKGLASMNMCIAYVGEGPVICIKSTNLKTYYYTLLTVTVYENGKFKKIDLAVYNPAKGKGHKCSILGDGNVLVKEDSDYNQYCKISVFMPNAGSINESVISVTNVGGDSFSVAVSMIRWNANKVFCKLINGTKISNINMYYTVDTERFCFYIKANWYAKIIVSRLGLVNTSKIESINAIPSGAIEVPIS